MGKKKAAAPTTFETTDPILAEKIRKLQAEHEEQRASLPGGNAPAEPFFIFEPDESFGGGVNRRHVGTVCRVRNRFGETRGGEIRGRADGHDLAYWVDVEGTLLVVHEPEAAWETPKC